MARRHTRRGEANGASAEARLRWSVWVVAAASGCYVGSPRRAEVDASADVPHEAAAGLAVQRSCAVNTPGCGVVTIPGGSFTMGASTSCFERKSDDCAYRAQPLQTNVSVGAFALDAYEVTVARFNAYWSVRARDLRTVRSAPIRYPGGVIAWQSPPNVEPQRQSEEFNWSPAPSARDAHPMNGVDYWMAQEFCVWDGGRLPTEAEWEYAARGSARGGLVPGRIYPWGDAQPSVACDRVRWNVGGCDGEDGAFTRRVGSFPAGASAGVFDLAGNVWEWVADNATEYTGAGPPNVCGHRADLRDPLCTVRPTGNRVLRGGSWFDEYIGNLRSATRYLTHAPAERAHQVGFRCARDVPRS